MIHLGYLRLTNVIVTGEEHLASVSYRGEARLTSIVDTDDGP
jgi:hypothetical protein